MLCAVVGDKCVDPSSRGFGFALKVCRQRDLCTCDSPAQEVLGGRDVVLLLSSIFAFGTRKKNYRELLFCLHWDLGCLVYLLYLQISARLFRLAGSMYLCLSRLHILECPYQISL